MAKKPPPGVNMEAERAPADDDRAPFLAAPPGSSPAASSSSRRWRCCALPIGAARRLRLPPARGLAARVAGSADVRVACRGLALLLLLLVVGVVGSVAMRQMVSPEIDALMRERQDLRQGLELLKLQLDNMTRIADSRLDMIHLLESELEKQAVQAAEAAATYPLAGSGALLPAEGRLSAGGALRRGAVASTVFYTWLLGSIVFLFVLFRIVRIIQAELQAQQKLARGDANQVERGQRTPPGSDQEASPPRPPRSILWDYHASTPTSSRSASSASKSRGKTGNAVLSPTNGQGAETSPQCYKRPQGSSPVDRYIV